MQKTLLLLLCLCLSACDAATLADFVRELETEASTAPQAGATLNPNANRDPDETALDFDFPDILDKPPSVERTPMPTAPEPLPTVAPGSQPEVTVSQGSQPSGHSLSDAEIELAFEINQYRLSKGLKALPVSLYLSQVARTHADDQQNHRPQEQTIPGKTCNLHSWSNQGPWSACCYTSDHAQSQCMWDKPKELTPHPGPGFEISLSSFGRTTTGKDLLKIWQGSEGHNNVIINQDIWADNEWAVMGVGINKENTTFANVWFASQPDP